MVSSLDRGMEKQATKKCTTCFVNLLQNELNRDVAVLLSTKKKPCNLIYLLQGRFKLACVAGVTNERGMEFVRPKSPFLPFQTPATQASLKICGKTCNIATQLNLQHFCKTSCTFLVACFTVHVALVMQFYALSQRESELDRIRLLHASQEKITDSHFWIFYGI